MSSADRGHRVVVLVEGPSDEAAIRALARARDLPMTGPRIEVVSMGGATNIARHLRRLAEREPASVPVGLCDAGEERFFRAALERHGRHAVSREAMAVYGFFVCQADLEDELIRALGIEAVEQVLRDIGELERFRAFQHQPEWRGRATHDQLHRFAGVGSGRKASLAAQIAARLTPASTPAPLRGLLDSVAHQAAYS